MEDNIKITETDFTQTEVNKLHQLKKEYKKVNDMIYIYSTKVKNADVFVRSNRNSVDDGDLPNIQTFKAMYSTISTNPSSQMNTNRNIKYRNKKGTSMYIVYII